MKKTHGFAWALAALLLNAGIHAGPIPSKLNYQGFLSTRSDTLPITGTVKMEFALWGEVSGAPVWSETHDSVRVLNGFFNVELGGTPFPPIIYSEPVTLEIKVNDQALSPRKPVNSVLFSHRALVADSLLNPKDYVAGSVSGVVNLAAPVTMPRLAGATGANAVVVASGWGDNGSGLGPVIVEGAVTSESSVRLTVKDKNGAAYDMGTWTSLEIRFAVFRK